MDYIRGSEWGRWDLHVHTPCSVLNNQFGPDWDVYVKNLFNRAISADIKAIGITDYFSIDGYKKLKNEYLKKDAKLRKIFQAELTNDPNYIDKIKNILILPDIELRLDDVISYYDHDGKNSDNKKLQYHIIFDKDLTEEDIEDNFLHKLTFKGAASCSDGIDDRPLTRNSIEEFGRYIKNCQPDFEHQSDLQAGMNCVAIKLDQVLKVLGKNKNLFKNKYILIAVEDDVTNIKWGDQAHMTRKVLYSVAHAIFSPNTKTIQWGLLDSTKTEFSSYKPCLWGSDAHSFDRMFKPANNKYCWIKANPTFNGLLQVIYSPDQRVFIGDEPPKLNVFKQQKLEYIDKLSIHKKENSRNQEIWFDDEIPFNIGLTAIIGNKGSGKSALSDILGYLCSCKNMEYASFLNHKRFRKEDKHYSDDYTCTLTWCDGCNFSKEDLSAETTVADVQRAQYLPQSYIETTCNNIGHEFQDEINNVIFSYIDRSDRGDAKSLDELISNRSIQIIKSIQEIRNKIELLNNQIIQLENKNTNEYRDKIKEKIAYLNDELSRTIQNKPSEVKKPTTDQDSQIAQKIVSIDKEISDNETQIQRYTTDLQHFTDDLQALAALNTEITFFIGKHKEIDAKIAKARDQFNIDQAQLHIDIDVDYTGISQKISLITKQKEETTKYISVNNEYTDITFEDSTKAETLLASETSLKNRNLLLRAYKSFLSNQTTAEQQKYQKYLDEYKAWEKRIDTIKTGSDDQLGIASYEKEKTYIGKELSTELSGLYNQRFDLISQIYDQLSEKVKLYQAIYTPVENKLHTILSDLDDQITFSSDIVPDRDLNKNVLSYINQRITSDFQGTKQGFAFVDRLIRETDFGKFSSVKQFVQNIFISVIKEPDRLTSLVKDRPAFYNFISGLSYLDVDYTLKVGVKTLNELSPGERGTVLLIFYLALEKNNCPLIIDQPEDNLDNQSVFNKLVPCINKAKVNRQVIIVTHNPNIAIACDADEIIYCDINKSKNEIRYSSGSIEMTSIKDKVVDILEGTQPAFDLRKLKYNS